MIFIIDTYAWIEYFIGSNRGKSVSALFLSSQNKFITLECCIAEIKAYALREHVDFEMLYRAIRANSVVHPVLLSHWLSAAQIRHEIRKKVQDFGLIDSIIVAKQAEMKCKVVTGDSHFKGLKGAVLI